MGLLAFRTAVKAPTIGSIASTSTSQLDITWSTPAGFTIALTELEFSLDGATGWTQVYSGTALSFSHTGRLASTTYYYRARVQDSQGNYSGYSAVSSQTTQANPTTIRYNGNSHWISPDQYNPSLATVQSIINAAPSIIKGLQLPITWAQMEGAQGNYAPSSTTGFNYIDQILTMCATKTAARNAYFGLMLYINPDGSGKYPSYVSSAGFDGGNGTYLTPSGVRVPCFWRSAVINAIIARDQAYMARYDNNPNFEMLSGPRGETDTTYNVTGGPGYSDAAWSNSWALWISAMSAARTRAQFRVIANFIPGGWARMDTLILQGIAAGAAMGGPDVYTRFITASQPYATDFGLVVHGYTKASGSWALDGTNYAGQGKLCLIHDAQTPEMGGKENQTAFPAASDLYAQAVANGDHYLVWWQHQTCWVSPYNVKKQLYWDSASASTTASDGSSEGNGHFTPDGKTYLTGNSVPLNTQRPGYYS